MRERAVRMVAEMQPNHQSESAAIGAVAGKLGTGSAKMLRNWIRQGGPSRPAQVHRSREAISVLASSAK